MSLPMLKARYHARAKSWALGEASTGTPQVGIEFEIEDGDHRGERISGYFALSDAAADYTLEKLRNCGWTGMDLAEIEGDASVGANVVELVVAPEDRKKDGQPVIDEQTGAVRQTLRIQFVNRAGGLSMKTALTDDKKKLLAVKMRGKLAAIDAKTKRESGAAPANGAAPRDDIPF